MPPLPLARFNPFPPTPGQSHAGTIVEAHGDGTFDVEVPLGGGGGGSSSRPSSAAASVRSGGSGGSGRRVGAGGSKGGPESSKGGPGAGEGCLGGSSHVLRGVAAAAVRPSGRWEEIPAPGEKKTGGGGITGGRGGAPAEGAKEKGAKEEGAKRRVWVPALGAGAGPLGVGAPVLVASREILAPRELTAALQHLLPNHCARRGDTSDGGGGGGEDGGNDGGDPVAAALLARFQRAPREGSAKGSLEASQPGPALSSSLSPLSPALVLVASVARRLFGAALQRDSVGASAGQSPPQCQLRASGRRSSVIFS